MPTAVSVIPMRHSLPPAERSGVEYTFMVGPVCPYFRSIIPLVALIAYQQSNAVPRVRALLRHGPIWSSQPNFSSLIPSNIAGAALAARGGVVS